MDLSALQDTYTLCVVGYALVAFPALLPSGGVGGGGSLGDQLAALKRCSNCQSIVAEHQC